ncbi:chloramphenicol acetyltransferase [Caproiciproducens faecalis]|uniref:Chloramphenicol acetyltransferase n=1 Tax=Caproiciproducens faecalis TaxID=2820301 RepID=A0ABS7DPS2_9FIRM|nr:chloramphenicol acetyltransferase [Caproiciproducens faecalis]MBW7572810.1 chloramphenicol acetyltransferase [Caproiciproducens faecalis]
MEYINMETWPRKEHYEYFHRMEYPMFNVSMNLDITKFLPFVKEHRLSFYYSMGFAATQAANRIPEFRCRIRGEQVVLHDKVHPSFTDLDKGSDLFKCVGVDLTEDILSFSEKASQRSAAQKTFMDPEQEIRDDLIYFTCVPWISFTQVTHPIALDRDDSIPRIAWGKYFKDGGKTLLPFSIQANHALMDGVHAGRYVQQLQNDLDSF